MGKPKKSVDLADLPEGLRKEFTARRESYISGSDLKNVSVKEDLADKAAFLFALIRLLTAEKLLGRGKAEETRTITSLAGAYRRALLDLGLTKGRAEEELEDL